MTDSIDGKVAQPRKQVLYKFILLCILLVSYFSYLSFQYDVKTGGIASVLTWSFFHRHAFKHEMVVIVFFLLVVIGYYKLVASLGIEISP